MCESERACPAWQREQGPGPVVDVDTRPPIAPCRASTTHRGGHPPHAPAAAIVAQITSIGATARGISASGKAPVTALCRALVDAGHDPGLPLEAFRGSVLCLRVRAIGAAGNLTVEESRFGRPVFRPLRTGPPSVVSASPIRQTEKHNRPSRTSPDASAPHLRR
jgi:hypothetical protein